MKRAPRDQQIRSNGHPPTHRSLAGPLVDHRPRCPTKMLPAASLCSCAERAPPAASSTFVQSAVESNHAHLVLASSPPIPAASADAAAISTSIFAESASPGSHVRRTLSPRRRCVSQSRFRNVFRSSTFHCRNVAPPFAERGARRNNLPPCPTTIHQNLNNVTLSCRRLRLLAPPA